MSRRTSDELKLIEQKTEEISKLLEDICDQCMGMVLSAVVSERINGSREEVYLWLGRFNDSVLTCQHILEEELADTDCEGEA